jgi:hypothetical protein
VTDFDQAIFDFRSFLGTLGISDDLLWVSPDDVLLVDFHLYVKKGDRTTGVGYVRAKFNEAKNRGVGMTLDAFCRVDGAICCFPYVARDDDEVQRLLMPKTGVKLSVGQPLKPATRVTNPARWWILKRRGQNYFKRAGFENM